jgi:hypothetical protein
MRCILQGGNFMKICKKCKQWNMDGANELCPRCQLIYDVVQQNIDLVIDALEEIGYKIIKAD